jgi:CYTH domain-containing protein
MSEIELENTYLVKYLPNGLEGAPVEETLDIYFPLGEKHATLRLRRRGEAMELTKKVPVKGKDSSKMVEHTIALDRDEYEALAQVPGKRLHKLRYLVKYADRKAEVDVFLDQLAGLVMVDFEFKTRAEQHKFKLPDFCLHEVTQDAHLAGGMLCGKSFVDIEPRLAKYKYQRLELPEFLVRQLAERKAAA